MTQLPSAGVYRLTLDHPPLRPDKRKRHDWRAGDLKAGTLFTVTQREAANVFRERDEVRRLTGSQYYAEWLTKLPATFIAALERVEDLTATQYLKSRGNAYLADNILDVLVASGKITLADVEQAESTVLSAEENEDT
jgi:hypothetical protein